MPFSKPRLLSIKNCMLIFLFLTGCSIHPVPPSALTAQPAVSGIMTATPVPARAHTLQPTATATLIPAQRMPTVTSTIIPPSDTPVLLPPLDFRAEFAALPAGQYVVYLVNADPFCGYQAVSMKKEVYELVNLGCDNDFEGPPKIPGQFPVLSENANYLLIPYQGSLYLYHLKDHQQERLAPSQRGDCVITSISWDGRRFAGACGSTESAIQLAVRTIDSDWTIIKPSEPGAEDSLWYTAAWSPDGQKLAFVNDLAHAPGVYVIDVDACLNDPTNCSLHVQGPYGSVLAEYLSWSPDGKNLAIIVDTGIEVCNINTKQCRVIVVVKSTDKYGMVHGAAWSPDGKWIGYIIDKEGGLSGQNLNVISPKGGALTFLTDKDVAQVAGWLYITPRSGYVVYSASD